jgi:mannose-6-phosphate isomerase-like protein (cupin superfamily)
MKSRSSAAAGDSTNSARDCWARSPDIEQRKRADTNFKTDDFPAEGEEAMKPVVAADEGEWVPFQVENSQGYEFKFGLIGKEYTDAYSVDLVRIAPGGHSPVHIDPDNHAFYIIEGKGRVIIAEEPFEIGPGAVVKIPFGVMHSLENNGTEPLLFLTIYDPPRERKKR